jgi:transposase-like protein
MILEEGRTIKDVSESLGLNYYTLRDWKIQYEERGDEA